MIEVTYMAHFGPKPALRCYRISMRCAALLVFEPNCTHVCNFLSLQLSEARQSYFSFSGGYCS